jgi:hypothetical protein
MKRTHRYCVSDIVGRAGCECGRCQARRRSTLVVWVATAAIVVVLLLGSLVAVKTARCQRPGNCWGSCVVGAGCGTGPGCACVPSLPGSPLGTCVGG